MEDNILEKFINKKVSEVMIKDPLYYITPDEKISTTELKGDLLRIEAKFTGDIQRIDSGISTIKDDIKEIRGSLIAQIWTLIGILITAVGGFLAAVGRSVFSLS